MPSAIMSVDIAQGFSGFDAERMQMLPLTKLNDAQKAEVQALIDGPNKRVVGPFVPLMRSPDLLDQISKLGEQIRFRSGLEARIRELVTCAVSRHVSNQVEWQLHVPLALRAGVAEETLESIRVGMRPLSITSEEELALDFVREVLQTNGVSDLTYRLVVEQLGELGVVELSTLIGYYVMVSWIMNVAKTPALQARHDPLTALPG